MKAAIIEQFGSLVVRDIPEPQMGEYDALCVLLYGATCTGTDSHIIDGVFPWISPLPTVLGHESVGRVIAVGPKVRHLRAGDLVTRVGTPATPDGTVSATWGGFAEYGIAKDHRAMCDDGLPESAWQPYRWNQVVPHGIDPRVVPMFTTWRETLSFLLRMGMRAGATVLVAGSGGNGLAYARHAANLDAASVTMVGAAYLEGAAMAKGGVTAYFDYKRDDLTAALNAMQPDGFDFIIDAVGKTAIACRILPCLKIGGTYGTYGIDDFGKLALDPSLARGPYTEFPCSYDEAETHQQVCEWVTQSKLDATLWYNPEQCYPLEAIGDAFAMVRQRQSPKALVQLGADVARV